MTVHLVPFLIPTCSSDAFFFLSLHHYCYIFFSILKAWFLFLYGVKDKKTNFIMQSVCTYLCHADQSNSACHLQYDSYSSPWDMQCICKVLITPPHKFYTLDIDVSVAVLILHSNLCIAVNMSLLHRNLSNFLCKISHCCMILMHIIIINNCGF